MLQSTGSQRVRHDLATEQQQQMLKTSLSVSCVSTDTWMSSLKDKHGERGEKMERHNEFHIKDETPGSPGSDLSISLLGSGCGWLD